MARTRIATNASNYKSLSSQQCGIAAGSADFVYAASDSGVGNMVAFPTSGNLLVLAKNTNVAAKTITITASGTDKYGRTGSTTLNAVPYSLAASDTAVFGPFDATIWKDANGDLLIDTESNDVHLSIVRIP